MKAPPSSIDALHGLLDEQPADADARWVLADAVEEAGDPHGAEALRWLAETGRRPHRIINWWWSSPDNRSEAGKHPYCFLPELLLRGLDGAHFTDAPPSEARGFPSRRSAEEAVMAAWGSLTPAERERLQREAQDGAPRAADVPHVADGRPGKT